MELNNSQHETFAQHVAAGLTYAEAARRAGYSGDTVFNAGSRLLKRPEVSRRVCELQQINTSAFETGAGARTVSGRISAINDRWERMRSIIADRAASNDFEGEPGGKTGLLVKTVKQFGSGDKAQVITTFSLDIALLTQLLAHEEAIATELGQRAKRVEQFKESVSISGTTSEMREFLSWKVGQLPAEQRQAALSETPELGAVIDVESTT